MSTFSGANCRTRDKSEVQESNLGTAMIGSAASLVNYNWPQAPYPGVSTFCCRETHDIASFRALQNLLRNRKTDTGETAHVC